MSFNVNGWRDLDFKIDDLAIHQIRDKLLENLMNVSSYPGIYSGKGIVFCAGGLSYFSCAWISINRLRRIGCNLPIEVWFLGTELSECVINQLKALDVTDKLSASRNKTSSN